MRNRLVAAREAAKLSQAEVGTALGVTPAAVSAWETGRNAPRAGQLVALAALLHVDAGELLADTTSTPPVPSEAA